MKVIFQKKKRVTVYTVADVARALQVTPCSMWYAIHVGGSFPAPTLRIGNRNYYTEKEFLDMTQLEEESVAS